MTIFGIAPEAFRTAACTMRSQSRAQSRRMLSPQRGGLVCWMASPLPKFSHPGMEQHHAPGIPGCGGDAHAMP